MGSKTTVLMMSFVALALLATAAAEEPEMPDEPSPDEVPEVSEEQIEDFVDAYTALNEVREDYNQRLTETDDQEAARELQLEANEAMVEAIESTGMDPEEYQQVATAVNADPEVRDRVTELLDRQE